jgi:hypothetical protein
MPLPEQIAEGDLSPVRGAPSDKLLGAPNISFCIYRAQSRKDRFWAALFDRLGPFSDDRAIAVT